MRVVQVANFYGPRSGGLRTAVDRLGAEYCAAGHEVFLIVPGRHAEHSDLSTGVVRITVPARLIPFTGGYRGVPRGGSPTSPTGAPPPTTTPWCAPPGLPAKNSIASVLRTPSPFRSAWTWTPFTRRAAPRWSV